MVQVRSWATTLGHFNPRLGGREEYAVSDREQQAANDWIGTR